MRIRRGACYLLEDETADTAYRLFVRLLTEMGSGFCISRIRPDKVRTRFGLEEVRIGWLAEVPGEDHFSANAMASVARAVQQFIQEHGSSGLVLLDGLEYVILHNGFQPTLLAFVEHLNEFAMGTQAVVLIAFRPQTLDPRELALLERNLQVLDGKEVKGQLDIEELGEVLGEIPGPAAKSAEKTEAPKVLRPVPDMRGPGVHTVRCPKCGTENDDEVAFCVYCGSLLPDHTSTDAGRPGSDGPFCLFGPEADATRGAGVPGAPARLRRPDRRRVFPLDPWRRLHAEHELAQRLPIMVGPDTAGRIVRAAPGWNRPERPPFLRPPRPVELPHVGIALGTRPQPVRRPRASPRRAGLRLPRHPDVALLLAGLFRIARRLDLDGNTRRAPRHLHRGRALLGPRAEARGPRGPSTDLETVRLRKENVTSLGRQAPQGRTYCDSSTPPGGMYRLPHSQDQIAASFPPASSILVTV